MATMSEQEKLMSRMRVTAEDFVLAIARSCTLRGFTRIDVAREGFYRGMAEAFAALQDSTSDAPMNLRFRVASGPTHADSATIRNAVTELNGDGSIVLENPRTRYMRILEPHWDAEEELDEGPIPRRVVEGMVDVFLKRYLASDSST